MGFSVRTASWRLTQWVRWDGEALAPDWGSVNATELYDHACGAARCDNDFDAWENANVAALPEHAPTVAALRGMLVDHFGGGGGGGGSDRKDGVAHGIGGAQ